MASAAGRVLVATPHISDGIFDQAVVFMLHHDRVGALGVIINRPSGLILEELLPRWADLVSDPLVVFDGGPVEPNGFIGVALTDRQGLELEALSPVESLGDNAGSVRIASVDLESDPAIAGSAVKRLRIFRGYAGWAPGQLDAELSAEAWFDLDADSEDLWTAAPEGLYERVMRRQSGRLRWFANASTDPSSN